MKNIALIFFLLISISLKAQVPSFNALLYDTPSITGYFFLVAKAHLMILDKYGATVYYNDVKNLDTDFKLQPNGIMSYFTGDRFWLMDSTFDIAGSVACKNYKTDFHELLILPDGHFLLFGNENVEMNLSRGSAATEISGDVIQELDTDRNVVFEWRAKEHFSLADADTSKHPFLDPYLAHWNSMALDKDGNILVSSRNFSEITKINRKDSSIIWRLGGKRNQFKFINSPAPFYGQRNIRVLANGDITFMDGGNGVKPHGARGMEFKLDEKKKTATLVWSYTYDSSFTTIAWGNVQRLSHSNTLIDFGGITGSSNLCFVIVDSSGKKLFQLNGTQAFRAYHYDELPFQLHRPQITCFDSLGTIYFDAGKEYDSYNWSNGDSTRIIPAMKDSVYSVFVPYGDGGFISSEKFVVNNLLHPCGTKKSTAGKK